MKILIVPDSYKGTLSSKEVCECIKNGILKNSDSDIEIEALPFADGGEGFAECMREICNGSSLYSKVHDIYGRIINCEYTVFGDTAVIDAATASGLQPRKAVMASTSYGTGELIKSAVSKGFTKIILGLGGTGCSDGGIGALAALGAKFYDENQKVIDIPKSGDLNYIFGTKFKGCVKPIDLTYACDVENEFFGKNGAAYVFAGQKGANKTQIEELDEGLQRLNAFFPSDISKIKGAGAAGGLCGGLYAIYGGEIKSGFDILSEYAHLEDKIANADLVITGEGKTDSQTLMGKLPYKISELCKKHGTKCTVISGKIENVSLGDKMISLVDENTSEDEAVGNAAQILEQKAKYVLQ